MSKHLQEDLLARYFEGIANEDELAQINNWIQQSEANRKELEAYHKIWNGSNKSNFNPDIDAAWQKVSSATVSKSKKSYWAFAAAIAAILAFGVYFLFNDSPEEIQYLGLTTENNQTEYTLEDGSTVTLNAFSHLEYPESFTEKERRVKLIGEAFFDISKNPEKPFIIEANGTEVRVLGTSFNIQARDENVKVSVNSGKVEFSKTEQTKVVLTKGEEAQYESSNDTIKTAPILDRNIFAFKTKIFEFDKSKLPEVIQTLNKGYLSNIKLEGTAWETYEITTRFENEKLTDALDIIAETLDLKVIRKEESYILAKNK
ncbi:FecR family protein [Jiulongibacter sp. NS-SX5]|uniref:FecR family protein n=1 Tax=Jiulongibacter sp. NS-SX5 TaxID=3463854 RepID=UPI004059468A